MKRRGWGKLLTMLWALAPFTLAAQLQMVVGERPVHAFGGRQSQMDVRIRNSTAAAIEAELSYQLVQASSSTVAPIAARKVWKTLRVLPGQTVVDTILVAWPEVRATTHFFVLWTGGDRRLGTAEVWIHPQSLLSELGHVSQGNLGILDPNRELSPLLKKAGLHYQDLDGRALETFDGPLVVLGPFASAKQMPAGLDEEIRRLAQRGTAVVWIVPAAGLQPLERLPKDYLVRTGGGGVFVASTESVAHLHESPLAQQNLVRFARLALGLEQVALPKFSPSPEGADSSR